ncbi:hypothetical protein D3C72_1439280 [compost metagenome]
MGMCMPGLSIARDGIFLTIARMLLAVLNHIMYWARIAMLSGFTIQIIILEWPVMPSVKIN